MSRYPEGITVIVCCYNSIKRLPKTLQALSKQECRVKWEVLIVDNASDDGTAENALAMWTSFNSSIPIQVVKETVPGLSNARKTGVKASHYANVLFCDDDNWLSQNYVQGMYNILMTNPQTAACGGMGVPIFENKEPYWFYEYAEAYALGSQKINGEDGKILNLYGAGLAVKKRALDELYRSGFNSILKDRVGKLLSSAGDTELTYALVLMGYELQCSDELKFFHFLTKERLDKKYLIKLFTSFGNDGPVRNLYYSYVSQRLTHKLIKIWIIHLLLSLLRLIKYLFAPPKKYGRQIYLLWSMAYINSLWQLRTGYSALKKNIDTLTISQKDVSTLQLDNSSLIGRKRTNITPL